jgi:hypothetical protein
MFNFFCFSNRNQVLYNVMSNIRPWTFASVSHKSVMIGESRINLKDEMMGKLQTCHKERLNGLLKN